MRKIVQKLIQMTNPGNEKIFDNEKLINRLASLWGFSESVLGGFLHLIKIPLRGMIICANSVFIISLLSYFSRTKEKILKVTFLVVMVKFIISPYTPLSAYFAVSFQGITGYFFYRFIRIHKLSVFLHSLTAQLQSSLQKSLVLTIFFGMTFWNSLDIYAEYILEKSGINLTGFSFSYSLIFVIIYVLIHLAAGIAVAVYSVRSPSKILNKYSALQDSIPADYPLLNNNVKQKSKTKKKFWWQRKSGIIIIVLFIIMALLPFIDPGLEKSITGNIFYMVVRAVVITLIWFLLISPLLVRYLKKFFLKKESIYINELNEILEVIPSMRTILKTKWNERERKGLRELPSFLSGLFFTLLFVSFEEKQRDE